MTKAKKTETKQTSTEMRAKAVADWTKYIEEVDRVDELGAGAWVKPRGFEDWHFVLLDKSLGFHMQTAASLMRQGYQEAPRDTRMIGAENQKERALYLCAPPEIYHARKSRKNQARVARARAMKDEFGGHLSSIESLGGGVSVTSKVKDLGPAV